MTEIVAAPAGSALRRAAGQPAVAGWLVLLYSVTVTLASAPPAMADPPDYSGYNAVDPKPFQNYFTYGGDGVQFTSPSGLLCRIAVISRGENAYAECFGNLAGVGDANEVEITTTGLAEAWRSSRPQFLTNLRDSTNGGNPTMASPSDFRLLPPGHSITYGIRDLWSGTCAVDIDTAKCSVTVNAQSGSTTKRFTSSPTGTTFS